MGGIIGGMDITSNGDIYAGVYPFGVYYTGLFKSSDNGDSWNKIETQFEDFQVFSVYITQNDNIWVGTDHQGALFRSTDDGETWENKNTGFGGNEGWAIGESKDGVLFAGDANGVGLYRSTDNGDNWAFSANILALAFAVDSNNVVYAGSFNGLYSSTDSGISWIQDSFLSVFVVSTVIVDTNNNIYCGTGYSFVTGDGLFFSDDGGQSWRQLGLAGKEVLSLAFDSERSLYAGTLKDGLYKTTDLGLNWFQYEKGLYKKEVYRLLINEQDDIFIGSEGGGSGWQFYSGGGVFRSTNGGDYFEQVGLPISMVKNIVFSGDSLVFTSTPSGVQSYNRITGKWQNLGLHNVEAVTITPSDYLYAATREDGLYKSTDLGKTWLLTNLTADTLMPVYNVVAVNNDTVFASTGFYMNLRRSIDGGQNWDILPVVTGETFRGLFFSNNTLLVEGSKNGISILYKTNNYGLSFDSLYSGFKTHGFNSSFSITNNDYVFLASRGDNLYGIIRSSDSGINWEQVLFKTISPTVFANDNGFLITSSDSIHLSTNYGTTWTNFSQSVIGGIWNYISNINVNSIGKLYFGTFTSGLFEVDITTSVEQKLFSNNDFSLSQNYPNPFNPKTKIEFEIEKFGFITLKVYDILGNEITTLVEEEKLQGAFEVEFDGTGLSSGIYFYQLRAGEFIQTKKLILLK
jgi:photosystem II stability/assembly factor-like uncharacterized protein